MGGIIIMYFDFNRPKGGLQEQKLGQKLKSVYDGAQKAEKIFRFNKIGSFPQCV
jgi:hypothetical protein